MTEFDCTVNQLIPMQLKCKFLDIYRRKYSLTVGRVLRFACQDFRFQLQLQCLHYQGLISIVRVNVLQDH